MAIVSLLFVILYMKQGQRWGASSWSTQYPQSPLCFQSSLTRQLVLNFFIPLYFYPNTMLRFHEQQKGTCQVDTHVWRTDKPGGCLPGVSGMRMEQWASECPEIEDRSLLHVSHSNQGEILHSLVVRLWRLNLCHLVDKNLSKQQKTFHTGKKGKKKTGVAKKGWEKLV